MKEKVHSQLWFLLFCAGLLGGSAYGQPSSLPSPAYWLPNSAVFAAVETNNILYIGGSFSQIGPLTGGFAAIDPVRGTVLPPVPAVGGTVACFLPDNQGGIYFGGTFNGTETVATTNLGRLLPGRTVDSNSVFSVDGPVSALALAGNTLFIGGGFTNVNGVVSPGLARLDLDSNQVTPFPVTLDGQVLAMAVSGQTLYIGGNFSNVDGTARYHLAAVDLTTGQVTPWDPSPDSMFGTGVILLTATGDRLYAAGDFTHFGAVARFTVAAFDLPAGDLSSWDAAVAVPPYNSPGVTAMAVSSNAVYLAGNFTSIGNQSRDNLGAVDTINGSPLPWNPGVPENFVYALAVSGNTVYAGGDFVSIGTNGPPLLAALDANSGAVLNWTPAPNGEVTALLPANGVIYVGGQFSSIGGASHELAGAIDLSSGRATAWNPDVAGPSVSGFSVDSLALSGDNLYLGGGFYGLDGQLRDALGEVSLADASLLPLAATLSGIYSASVFGLYPAGTNLVVTGNLAASIANYLVLDGTSGARANWNFGENDTISSFAVIGNTLFAGGAFTQISGQPRSYLAAFDVNSRQLLPWSPNVDGPVNLILARDQSIIARGEFSHADGQFRSNLAVFDSASGELALGPAGLAVNGTVRSLAASANALYLSGKFSEVNGSNRTFFAAIDLINGQTRSWDPQVSAMPGYDATGFITVVGTNTIAIAGSTSVAIGNQLAQGLAIFPITNPPPAVQIITPANQTVVHAPAQLPIQIQASAPSGIARVDVYSKTNLIFSFTQPPYSTNWIVPKHIGDYLVTAVAYDQFGEFSLSPAARVTVILPTGYIPPTVAIQFPVNNATYALGTTINVQTLVSTPTSTVETFTFLLGTNEVAILTNAPYSLTLTNLAPGTYSLSADLMDEFGIHATNGPVTFTINAPPQVTLQSPNNGLVTGSDTPVVLTASVGDLNDTVRQLSFLNGTNVLATLTNSPFTFTLTNLSAGAYAFQAVAVNSFGAIGTSAVVNVTVTNSPRARATDPALYAATESGAFGLLDPVTGAFTVIGQNQNLDEVGGLGFTTNGNLYAFDGSRLYLINTNNGATTTVGPGPGASDGWGMTAAPDGTLYGYLAPAEVTSLYTINPTNGVETLVGSMGVYLGGGFACDRSGNLFITTGNAPEKLYSVNPSTGAATLIGSTGSGAAYAMACAGNALYLVDLGGAVWTVSTNTGHATKIGNYGNTKGIMIALASSYAPVIQSIALANGDITITWTAVPGRFYQLQGSPDLSPGSWVGLGAPVAATGTSQTAVQGIGTNSAGYYRIAVLP